MGKKAKMKPSDWELEEIAKLVKEGFTSGILDGDEDHRLIWNIEIEIIEAE